MNAPVPAATQRTSSARWPLALAAGLLLAVLLIGLLRFPAVPDPMPTHWNFRMEPDAWGAKSLVAFLAPLGVGVLTVGLFWTIPLLGRLQDAARPPADAAQAERTLLTLREPVGSVPQDALIWFSHRLALLTAVLFALITLLTWFEVTGVLPAVLVSVTVAALLGVIVVGIIRLRRTQ